MRRYRIVYWPWNKKYHLECRAWCGRWDWIGVRTDGLANWIDPEYLFDTVEEAESFLREYHRQVSSKPCLVKEIKL